MKLQTIWWLRNWNKQKRICECVAGKHRNSTARIVAAESAPFPTDLICVYQVACGSTEFDLFRTSKFPRCLEDKHIENQWFLFQYHRDKHHEISMKYPCHYEISICWSCWSITTSWASGWTLLEVWGQMEHLKSPWRQSPGGEIFYRSGLKN